MSPATGFSFLTRGAPKWYSQRVTPRPFVDCMFAALCTPLSFMGYDIPPSFVDDLRRASGVPRKKPNGDPQGTNTADTKTALRQLIPDCPIQYGGMTDQRMLERLAAGEIAVRVMVRAGQLPQELRRFFKPSFVTGHAVALSGARRLDDGDFEVQYLDPMGRPLSAYQGVPVRYAKIRGALFRTPSGMVRATWGEKNAALPGGDEGESDRAGIFSGNNLTQPTLDEPVVLSRARFDEFARINKGTPFLHPTTRETVTRAAADGDFRLAGRSSDGRLCGVWVNTRKVRGSRGMTLLLVDRQRIGEPFVRPEA
jgi:hypothetical protein